MKRKLALCALAGLTLLSSQTGPAASHVANLADAPWTHQGDPSKSDSVTLREDPRTGATELFARYPAGHVFAPHWHEAAFLPAREVQRLACVSKTPCTFYVYWDGKPDSHPGAPAR